VREDDDNEGEYRRLRGEVERHDELYYGDEPAPEISDQEYDGLVGRVMAMEMRHPEWVMASGKRGISESVGHAHSHLRSPLSPTQSNPSSQISSATLTRSRTTKFPQVQHSVPMLSLMNTYSIEDVEAFVKRVEKAAVSARDAVTELENSSTISFVAELKVDGVALALKWNDAGELQQAITRGNGSEGEDVTENVLAGAIQGLPSSITIGPAEVRGEVFISKRDFALLNQAAGELNSFSNPRNAAAGSLKLLDPNLVASRRLSFLAYDLMMARPVTGDSPQRSSSFDSPSSQAEALSILREQGFLPMPEWAVCHFCSDILEFVQKIKSSRANLPFEIDGIVVKVNERGTQRLMGSTSKFPRWAVAFKFAADFGTTRLSDIIFQVSRNGIITPVASLEPVAIGGARITRATLHNFAEIERLGLQSGDLVVVERSGDVIPKIIAVEGSVGDKTHSKIPNSCPVCNSTLEWDGNASGRTTLRCMNRLGCAAQAHGRLVHFASKAAMDISHVGPAVVSKLIDRGLVSEPADFYRLKEETLISHVEGFKEKSARRLVTSITSSRGTRPLWRFLVALGIPGIGQVASQQLATFVAKHWERFPTGLGEEPEWIENVQRMGPKTARAVFDFFSDRGVIQTIDSLLAVGVAPVLPSSHSNENITDVAEWNEGSRIYPENQSGSLRGLRIVISGEIGFGLTRKDIVVKVKELGGRVTDTVSKRTDFVVSNLDRDSAKLRRARELGIRVVTPEELQKLLGSA